MSYRLLLTLCVLLLAVPAACQQRDDPGRSVTRLSGSENWQKDFPRHAVPLDEIISGGPPKDGIPALDRPTFVSADAADRWLGGRDPVIVVEHGGRAKAYPLSILIWHEIVNDRVGGLPVAVTFCPLCNTALVFDRRVGERTLDFGTTGRLRNSDLVMYDRQTETWWQQATGEAIVGALTGTDLRNVASNTLAWKTARELYPELTVLSRDTGYDRDYGRNPYVGYDRPGGNPISAFFDRDTDPRLPTMERVVAIDLGKGWAAPFSALREERVVNERVGDTEFAVFWAPGAASALDEAEISAGRDVGQTAVYRRALGNRTLTFEADRGGFRDRETGSRWDLAGRAVSGPLRGRRLTPLAAGNHFWFAWVVFRPDTEVWTG
ncbi:DUF3179 domain-containing protein [soil metagenome]